MANRCIFVSQIQDITAQRSSEQRLFESEQRSRITLDAVADLVLSVSLMAASTTPTRLRCAPWPVMAPCRWPAQGAGRAGADHRVRARLGTGCDGAAGPGEQRGGPARRLLLRLGTQTVPVT